MFEQSILNRNSGGRRPFAVMLSLAIQLTLLTIAILVPLVFADVLPAAQLTSMFVLPPLPIAARPAEPPPETTATARRVKVKPVATNVFTAPAEIPKTIPNIVEEIEIDPNLVQIASTMPNIGNSRNGTVGVMGLNAFASQTPAVAPPPPEQPQKPNEVIRVRRGGSVVEAQAISRPSPEYPELAKRARVEGDVQLNAVIGVDGNIKELRVHSGHPLLVNAAVQAVSQWRYRPTILNGDPVEVVTQITVNFRLR